MSGGVKGNTPWPAARLKRTTGCVHNEAPTPAKLATNRELQRLRMGVERDVEIIIGFIQVGTIDERSDGVHVSYDKMESYLLPYGNADALAVARNLDAKVTTLLRECAS